jgi:hypothetical protein
MAKIYGLQGAMTGKLANTVMAVRNGEQIARKYQPVVTNPNTPAQVAARAKLKMLSQLSAVMGPHIAMPRVGAVSPRNLFVKANYPASSFSNNDATIDLLDITLTKSVVSLPAVLVNRTSSVTTISLGDNTADIDRVVYALYMRQADNTIRFYASSVVSTPGEGNRFPWETPALGLSSVFVVYAYGVRDNTDRARATFGNTQVSSADTMATLVTTRQLTESDITLTETRAANVPIPA